MCDEDQLYRAERLVRRASRRTLLLLAPAIAMGSMAVSRPGLAQLRTGVSEASRRRFIAEAERMRQAAVKAGDQSYGAVVVRGEEIMGWGPSRVVRDLDPNAHAERVAIKDAQARIGEPMLTGAVLYSTSRACAACEAAASAARIGRMYWGPQGTDAGAPRR